VQHHGNFPSYIALYDASYKLEGEKGGVRGGLTYLDTIGISQAALVGWIDWKISRNIKGLAMVYRPC